MTRLVDTLQGQKVFSRLQQAADNLIAFHKEFEQWREAVGDQAANFYRRAERLMIAYNEASEEAEFLADEKGDPDDLEEWPKAEFFPPDYDNQHEEFRLAEDEEIDIVRESIEEYQRIKIGEFDDDEDEDE